MPVWLQWTVAFLVLLALAPFAARLGRAAKGGAIMVGLLLGLGQALDPPSHHRTEVGQNKRKDRAAPGDPPVG
jgi:hypothetical protein